MYIDGRPICSCYLARRRIDCNSLELIIFIVIERLKEVIRSVEDYESISRYVCLR